MWSYICRVVVHQCPVVLCVRLVVIYMPFSVTYKPCGPSYLIYSPTYTPYCHTHTHTHTHKHTNTHKHTQTHTQTHTHTHVLAVLQQEVTTVARMMHNHFNTKQSLSCSFCWPLSVAPRHLPVFNTCCLNRGKFIHQKKVRPYFWMTATLKKKLKNAHLIKESNVFTFA
jgi:hypothetical protein